MYGRARRSNAHVEAHVRKVRDYRMLPSVAAYKVNLLTTRDRHMSVAFEQARPEGGKADHRSEGPVKRSD